MRNNRYGFILLVVTIALILGATGMYFILENTQTIINKQEKEVTIHDEGIADAVDKLYDATVVVATGTGSGTGFVYKVEGNTAYIITNAHVIGTSTNVTIQFTDGSRQSVTVVGSDDYSDIAVLSTNKDNIVAVAEIGETDPMRLGDTVFAIGAPLSVEYSWTVTRGILSGKDRLVEINTNWVISVLQTDAAINSGNSGGPLANSNGEVIGVTNMKLVASGVEGIGFAIPIEDALYVANELIKNGSIARPLLGVETFNVTDRQLLAQYNITLPENVTSGAIIANVREGSVAAEAGLRSGDVVTKIGKYDITSSARLRFFLYRFKVGDVVTITYLRDGSTQNVEVTLTQRAN